MLADDPIIHHPSAGFSGIVKRLMESGDPMRSCAEMTYSKLPACFGAGAPACLKAMGDPEDDDEEEEEEKQDQEEDEDDEWNEEGEKEEPLQLRVKR